MFMRFLLQANVYFQSFDHKTSQGTGLQLQTSYWFPKEGQCRLLKKQRRRLLVFSELPGLLSAGSQMIPYFPGL
jgi:hypothetical protein